MKKLTLILLIFPLLVLAQKPTMEFTGFIDSYHALRSSNEYDWLSSRSRFRGEITMRGQDAYFFTSVNATHNNILPERTGFQLRESYFDYSKGKWNLRAGRQIVSWGVADGIQVSDMITPMDMTEFLAQDFDDVRMPVNALRLKYIRDKMNAELICIPISEFSILPIDSKNPWSMISHDGPQYYDYLEAPKPDFNLENSEIGMRFAFYLSGIDFSVSALHTWNKTPVFLNSMNPTLDTVFIKGHHQRMQVVGLDFSLPVRQFVIRGEGGVHFSTPHSAMNANYKPSIVSDNTIKALIGIDWYPGHDWTLTSQFVTTHINDYREIIIEEQTTHLATLGITKRVFRSTLSLSSFIYMDINNKAFFDRTSIDYSLNDNIHIMAGYDWFHGDEGMFALYEDNSEFWLKFKYGF